MKRIKKLFLVLLCTSMILTNNALSFAATGSAYTSFGVLGGHMVQGTLIISTNNAEVRTGYYNISGTEKKAYFSYAVVVDYINTQTGIAGYRNHSLGDVVLGIGVTFSPPSNCVNTGGSSYHTGNLDGVYWSDSLSL